MRHRLTGRAWLSSSATRATSSVTSPSTAAHDREGVVHVVLADDLQPHLLPAPERGPPASSSADVLGHDVGAGDSP
jgi:hypothetical protein